MASDFRAERVRLNKIITSGSAPNSRPMFALYHSSAATNFTGGTNVDLWTGVGKDVYAFFSGSKDHKNVITGRGVTLFGGDVVVSGTLYADKQVIEIEESVTGSLTVSGSLIVSQSITAGQNLHVNSVGGAFGFANFGSTAGTGGYGFRDSGGTMQFKNSGGAWAAFGASGGGSASDVGWIGPQAGKIITTGSVGISGSLVVSGTTLDIHESIREIGFETTNYHKFNNDGQSFYAKGGKRMLDLTSITSQDQVTVNIAGLDVDFRVESFNKSKALYVDASEDRVSILSGSLNTDANGDDVAFFVSGSIGGQAAADRGVSLFGGDLVTSGVLHVQGTTDLPGTTISAGIVLDSAPESAIVWDSSPAPIPDAYIYENGGSLFISASNQIEIEAQTAAKIRGYGLEYAAFASFTGQKAAAFNRSNEDIDFRVGNTSLDATLWVNAAEKTVNIDRGLSDSIPGPDINFYVSGSIGGKDQAARGVSLFGGDLVVSGGMHVDTTTFVVDQSNNRVGVGTNLPNAKMNITSDVSGETILSVEQHNNNSDAPNLEFVKSRGTYAAPGKVGSGDFLGHVQFKGYDGSSEEQFAAFYAETFGTINAGSHPAKIVLKTCPAGSTTLGNSAIFNGGLGGTISGSIHETVDGVSYLVAGTNVTITSASNGQVTINSTAVGTVDGSGVAGRVAFWQDSDTLTSDADLTFDGTDLGVGNKIVHVGDADTYINFTDDDINISVGGVNMVDFTENAVSQDEITFNEAGADLDFRVESDDNDHMFFINADDNRISIGTQGNNPQSVVHIKDTSPEVRIQRALNAQDSVISFAGSGGVRGSMTGLAGGTNDIVFKTFNGAALEETARFGGDYSGEVRRVIFLSGSSMHAGAMQPTETSDINFFVSGSEGSMGGGSRGTATFGGDLVVSGGMAVDEDTFFVDQANNRIGVGTRSPNAKINVTSNVSGETLVSIEQHNSDNGDAPNLEFVKSRGTYDAPSVITSGDFLGDVQFKAYDGNSEDQWAGFYVQSYGTVSNSSHPAKLVVRSCAEGSTLLSTAAIFNGGLGGTISGSIHETVGGVSYLVAGTNVTITSASNGQVTIASTGGGGSSPWTDAGSWLYPTADESIVVGGTTMANSDAVIGGTNGDAEFNKQQQSTGDFRIRSQNAPYAFFVDASTNVVNVHADATEIPGTDANFFVSGSTTGDYGTAVFGGNAVVSGTLYVKGSTNDGSGGNRAWSSLVLSYGIGFDDGDAWIYEDGNDLYVAGRTDTFISASDDISLEAGDDLFIDVGDDIKIKSGNGGFFAAGTDTYLHVSGAIGGHNTTGSNGIAQSVVAFGGDVVISGSMRSKQIEIFKSSYVEGSTGNSVFIPMMGSNVEAAGADYRRMFVAPFNGRLIKVLWRPENAQSNDFISEIWVGSDGDSDPGTLAERVQKPAANAVWTTNPAGFTSTSHFMAGQVVGVKINPSDAPGACNVTMIFEFDMFI